MLSQSNQQNFADAYFSSLEAENCVNNSAFWLHRAVWQLLATFYRLVYSALFTRCRLELTDDVWYREDIDLIISTLRLRQECPLWLCTLWIEKPWFEQPILLFTMIVVLTYPLVPNKKYGNFVPISSLTGKGATQKFKNFCSSSLWTYGHIIKLK